MDSEEHSSEDIMIRYTEPDDAPHLYRWLSDPETLRWFAMSDDTEVRESANRWISFYRYNCCLTAVIDGVPAGITTLYLQPYKRLNHQCEMGLIVGPGFRGRGVGGFLLTHAMKLAKNNFSIELLHLQVYAENPAIKLYKRYGFREFGRQEKWIKEGNAYVARVFMERYL